MRRAFAILALVGCAKTISGPTPAVSGARNERDKSTGPAYLCNAQGDPADGWLVDALGNNFAPLPTNSLAGTPDIAMPEVKLAGPESYTLPAQYVRFSDKTRMPLAMRTANTAADAHALTAGDYSLTVTNVSGGSATAAAAVRVIPPPTIASVSLSGSNGGANLCADQAQTMTITGTGFRTDKLPTAEFAGHIFTADS